MEIKKSENVPSLIGIEYPGRVENVDKLIETLGGMQDLSKSFSEKQKLQLKFHPKSFYNKSTISNEPTKNESTGMLLKLRIRRPKKPSGEDQTEYLSAELIGTVSTMYKFNNFADFQYLPIAKNETTNQTECIYGDIIPDDITTGPQWFRDKPDMQLFLPPVQFSRTDAIQPIVLRNEPKSLADEDDDERIIRFSSRSSRTNHGTTIMFDMVHTVPTKPKEAIKDLKEGVNNAKAQEEFEEINKLFEQRPIWTLSSLKAHIREPQKRLSYIIARIAFYYTTGPWRNCFVKYGYDPRKMFESRFFQMIDYRVKQGAGFKGELKRKRTSAISKRIKVHQKTDGGQDEADIDLNYRLRQKEAIFTPDTIPPFRARHYQVCDIQIPKIQEMLNNIISPISGGLCDEKRGWFPQGFLEDVRAHLSQVAQNNMMKLCKEKNMTIEEFKACEDSKSESIDQDNEELTSNDESSDEQESDEN